MRKVRILLVAREGEARDAYLAELTRLGVDFDAVLSFSEIPQLAGEKKYNGLLLDILTLVRTRKDEKDIAYECINYYPSTRLKWDPAAKRINLLYFETSAPTVSDSALQAFIDDQCRPFAGRALRKFTRRDLILNVTLAREADSITERGQKTFSINVSRGGVFVQTVEEFMLGESVWLSFEELFDRIPVKAEVCWRQEWGQRRAIPGIGVRFNDLTEAQCLELNRLLKR